MTKIYDFFNHYENPCKAISEDEGYDTLSRAKNDTKAMLELFNLDTSKVYSLPEVELYSLHNALIRVKYFQETGKVLADKNIK